MRVTSTWTSSASETAEGKLLLELELGLKSETVSVAGGIGRELEPLLAL